MNSPLRDPEIPDSVLHACFQNYMLVFFFLLLESQAANDVINNLSYQSLVLRLV